jgi:pSer/pThr/pTyr-binding forkhead associated (FHA) protein
MPDTSRRPKAESGSEVKAELDAERAGHPFLVYRDGDGTHRIVTLDQQVPVWVGRRPSADLSLSWDKEVSGVHAQLEPAGGEWTLVDDGLSRNGSFVGSDRVTSRRRLRDGDLLRFGDTLVAFRDPNEGHDTTVLSDSFMTTATLSDTQRKILIALCRPFAGGKAHATPATNQKISEEVFLGVDAVKQHMRALFSKFEVEDLPQNSKRAALAERVLQSGLISDRDF